MPRSPIELLNVKQIVSGGIISGMIFTLPFGIYRDILDASTIHALEIPDALPNVWLYAAVSTFGCLLAWTTPSSPSAWNGQARMSSLLPHSIIWMSIPALVDNLADHSLRGAVVNTIFIGATLIYCAVFNALHCRKNAKAIE